MSPLAFLNYTLTCPIIYVLSSSHAGHTYAHSNDVWSFAPGLFASYLRYLVSVCICQRVQREFPEIFAEVLQRGAQVGRPPTLHLEVRDADVVVAEVARGAADAKRLLGVANQLVPLLREPVHGGDDLEDTRVAPRQLAIELEQVRQLVHRVGPSHGPEDPERRVPRLPVS
eukprot:4654143-Pyramimonas_sp.AAC.1